MSALLLALVLLQAPAANGRIHGTVLTTANEPLPTARVELTGGAQGPVVTRTDGQGQFVFANVPPGRYHVSVKKEGYVRQEYGQTNPNGAGTLIVIEPGSQVQGLAFRLQPASTIAGLVRNEDGIPIANILVQALRRTYGARGNRTITLFSNTLTDDLGAYRLYWIDPGDYYINASYLPQLPTPVNANEDAPRAAYSPTYYPGIADPAEARPARIDGGTVVGGIDFRLQRAPAVKVRGTIYSILSGAPTQASVTLIAPGESGSTARYSIQTDEKGVFEMKGVIAGSYVLSARKGDGQIGFSTIKVADTDYPKADVVLGPGVTVTARFFGESLSPVNLGTAQVSLIPLETYLPLPAATPLQVNGTAAIANVQPASYLLRVSGLPDDAYVKAARSDGQEVLERFVQVQYERQNPVDVQLAFDGGQIAGSVLDPAEKGAPGATVVLVPDSTRRHRPDQYRVVTADAMGAFAIRGIPPGDYKVFAWESVEANAYLNPDFMMNYGDLGAAATVRPSEKIPAQLRLIPSAR